MTGIEMLREYEKYGASYEYCRQVPKMLGKECYDFGNCYDCHRFVCNAIADQIEREIGEAVNDGTDDEDDAFGDMRGARTGIEMLRSYVHHARVHVRNLYINHVADINAVPLYEKLRECLLQLDEIADRIERETLPRPRFEDGEPVKVGDRFLNALGRECVVHSVMSSDAFGRRIEGIVYASNCDCHITVGEGERLKRPEPPDTWEKIEADVAKGYSCSYFGFADDDGCDGCKVNYSDMGCSWEMTNDVLRRAKKLAGVE